MCEQFDAYPLPQVEEDIDWYGYWQQQAVKTDTGGAGATLREVFIHGSRVEQATQRHCGHQHSQSGE